MAKPKICVSVVFDPEEVERIEEYAERTGKTRSALLRLAIREYLKANCLEESK